MKKCVFLAIISAVLIIGISQTAFAQTGGFFVEIGGQASGPHDEATLHRMVADGRLTRASLVWREGMAGWVPAGTVSQLIPLFQAAPPPLPGAPPPLPAAVHHAEPWGGHPVVAGLANSFLGIWSFTNNDVGGGVMTAALQLGGVALTTVAWNLFPRTWSFQTGWHRPVMGVMLGYAGNALTAVGTIYGFARGFSQFNRQMAAATISHVNNPFDIALVPGQNGMTKLAFTWTIRY